MARILSVLLIVSMFTSVILAEESIMDWQKDSALKSWYTQLPAGWVAKIAGNVLTVERSEPIWILAENKINAPLNRETAAQRSARIRKNGHKDVASLSIHLSPLRSVKDVWSSPKLPQYISSMFEVNLLAIKGFEDDMSSVDPPLAIEELSKVKTALLQNIAIVVTTDQYLWEYEGQLVVVKAVKSREIWQHIMAAFSKFPYSEYIDWDDAQTVAYSQNPLPGKGPWELTGRIIAVGGGTKKPGTKDSVEEYHIKVESVRSW